MLLLRILFGLTAVLGVTGANVETWSLVFDAGSSGTRINIFKILKESGKPDVFQQFIPSNKNDEDKLKVKPGLSGHLLAGKLGDVRADIAKLLAEAARWVPTNKQANTPVRLGATAGLRLLTIAQQNDVINAAANALADKSINPFKNYGAFIMSGEEEGLFGWLAVNYFSNKFATFDPAGTVGALDMGGASTQIAYNSAGQILEGQQSAVVNGNRYRIYGTSFLKFGNDQFETQVFTLIKSKSTTTSSQAQPYDNPCQCKGFAEEHDNNFFLGSGKWDACASLIEEIFNIDNQPCVFTNGIGRCSILGKYLAPKAKNFYAFAAYFYAASGLGLLGWNDAKKLSPNQFKTAGMTWCAATKTTFSDPYKKDYCRQSAYIYTLLTKAYHFQGDDATSITFARKVNGFSVSWALGMAMSYAPSSSMAQVTTQAGLDPPVCQRKNMVKPGSRCAHNEYNSRAEVEELCKRTPSCTGYAQAGLTNEKTSYYIYGPAPVDEILDPQGRQHGAHQCYKKMSVGTYKKLSWQGGCHTGAHGHLNYLCQDKGPCKPGLAPPICQKKNMIAPGYRCSSNEYQTRAEVEQLCKQTHDCTGYAQVDLTNERGSYYIYGPQPVDETLHADGKQHGGHQCYKRYDTASGIVFKALAWKGGCHVGPVWHKNYLCEDIGACVEPEQKICASCGDPHIKSFPATTYTSSHTEGWLVLYSKEKLTLKVKQKKWPAGGWAYNENFMLTEDQVNWKGSACDPGVANCVVQNDLAGFRGRLFLTTGDKNFPAFNVRVEWYATTRPYKGYHFIIYTNEHEHTSGLCSGKRRLLSENSGGVPFPGVNINKTEAEAACKNLAGQKENCIADIRLIDDKSVMTSIVADYVGVQDMIVMVKNDNKTGPFNGSSYNEPSTSSSSEISICSITLLLAGVVVQSMM